jgi:pimeloyl-ACP methyl ester carboxylesterase
MELTTTTVGTGPRHVGLVHGLSADSGSWGPLVGRMLETGRFTVTTVDLRGHGTSDRASSYRLDDMADDLVETLPAGLHSVVGHSLGGAVLARAVARLAPEHAVYLDPGFGLSLPSNGVAGRLFWMAPLLSLGVAGIGQARASAAVLKGYSPEKRALIETAKKRFDRRMVVGVFREVVFSPMRAAAPAVPSTIVLSDQSLTVLSDDLASQLEQHRWRVRRLAGVHHDMHVEAPDRLFDLIEDAL